MAGKNDLNMLLKAQVIKIRAELDVAGSMPNIKNQVDEISKKLENKPVKLRVELDSTVKQLNESIRKIKNKIETSKTFKPLKIKVEIDVDGSATKIKEQLEEVNRVVNEFNNKYGEQLKKMQKQVDQYNKTLNSTGASGGRSKNSAVYQMIDEIKEAEKLLRQMYSPKTGSGLFGFKEFRDAEGNVKGFIAQLEKANGVVHKIRYEWNKEAGKFTPVTQETVDTTQKHVHKATQSLRSLSAEIQKLQDGASKTKLWEIYDNLEKRASHGTLTQDAVRALQRQIKEEQVLQQQVDKTNKEYIERQKLLRDIRVAISRGIQKEGHMFDVRPYRQLMREVKNGTSSIAEQRLELQKLKDAEKKHEINQRKLLENTKKRLQIMRELRSIERQTTRDDETSKRLIAEIKYMSQRAKYGRDWIQIQEKMNALRNSTDNAKELKRTMVLMDKAERKLREYGRLQNQTSDMIEKNIARMRRIALSGYADLEKFYYKINKQVRDLREENKKAISEGKVLLSANPTNERDAMLARNIRAAVKNWDIQALQAYIGQIYKGQVETIRMEQATDHLGRAVDRLHINMAGTGKTIKSYVVDLDKANGELRQMEHAFNYNANRNLGIIEQLKIAMARVPTWMTAMTAFYGSIRSVRAMTREILEVDKALTELKRVASEDMNLEYVFKGAVRMARELGNNVHDVMQTLNDFSRTFGEFNERQLLAITNTATLMSNVSELSAIEAGETLIATMNAFNIEAEESIRIVDAFNEVDNNFAVSTKQLAEGMSKAASTAKTFGVTMEESVGHITAISAVTQESGKIIGNSLKTIYSRITTLDDAEEILNSVGVSIREIGENGEQVRDVQDILADLGEVWGDLTDQQRQQIAVTVAGRYQLSRFLALMNNWDMAVKATATALTSQGSAMRENQAYLESFEARINQLKATFTELSLAVGDAVLSDSITLLIDLLNNLGQAAIKLIDNFGALPLVTGAIGGLMSAFGMFKKLNGDIIAGTKLMGQAFKEAKGEVTGLQGTMKGLGGSVSILAHSAMPAFNNALKGMVSGLKAIGSATIYTAIFTAIGTGIEWVISKFQEQKRIQEEIEKSNKELVESYRTYRNAEQSLEDLINKHDELRKKIASGEIKEGTEAYNEYLQVNQELADALPTMVEYIDTKGVAHLRTADAMRKELEVAEELSRQYAEDADKDFSQNVKDRLEDLDETFDKLKDIHKKIKEAEESIESGRESAKWFGIEYTWDADFEKLESKIRDLEQQTKGYHRQMQAVMNDTMSMIADSTIASLEASGHFQQMTDSQIAYVEKFSQKYSEALQYYIDALKDPEIFNNKEMRENLIKGFQDVAEHAKEESVKIGEAIHDLMSEMLDGISDPKEIQKIKDNFDLLLSTLPDSFTDSIASADEFKKKIKEVIKITQQMDTGAGIDDIAKQLESYFGSYELARDYVIKLGFAYDNQKIKSEALQKAQEGEIENLEEIIELTIEAVDVTRELFGEDLGGNASALQTHIEMLKAMKQLGEEGSEAWQKSLDAISEFFLVSNEEVEKNFSKYAELIELISNFRFEFNDDGQLEKEVVDAYNRIKKLSDELNINIPINADTKELEKATKAIEKNAETTKENTKAIEENAKSVDILKQKFQEFKDNANQTTRSAYIDTIKSQLEELDGQIVVTKDEAGRLKLAMADGTESEWINTLQKQLEDLGIDLLLIEDETGNIKVVLNDDTGSKLLTTIKKDAEDAKTNLGDARGELDAFKQEFELLPNSFSRIDFLEVYGGLTSTTKKMEALSDALNGLWEDTKFVIGKMDGLSGKVDSIKDAIIELGNVGTLSDLIVKASQTEIAIGRISEALRKMSHRAEKIPMNAFDNFNTSAKSAKLHAESLKISFDSLLNKISGASGSSLVYSMAIKSINASTVMAVNIMQIYVEKLSVLSQILSYVARFNKSLAVSQSSVAESMKSAINSINLYGTVMIDSSGKIAQSYINMVVIIAENTAKVIGEYKNHGRAVLQLVDVTDVAWKDMVRTTINRGQTLISVIKKVASQMHKAFKDKMDAIVDVAEKLPARIGKGVRDHMNEASSSMDAVAKDMVRRFKKELGIRSPSRVFEELGGWVIKGLANGLTGEDLKSLGKKVFSDFGGGIFDSWEMIKAYVSNDWSNFASGVYGASVERWRGVAMKALAMTGQLTPANLERLLFQMKTESGGNPRAINLWDINAKRGTPSKGLMQVIDPTFQAYKMPGYDNIWNPLDNILAAIRYTLARYGSLLKGWRGVGYEEGGFIDKEHIAMVGEGDKREVIIPLEQYKSRAIELWKQAGEELGLLRKRRGYGGFGAFMGGGFGAFSGEGGSAEGGSDSGTSGVVKPSIYDGGVTLDGEYQFIAFKNGKKELEELYKWNANERKIDAYNHAISMIETRMKAMTENTLQYRNALKQIIFESQKLASIEQKELKRLKDRQKAIEKQIKSLGATSKHTEAQRKKYNELQREYEQNISKIQSLERSIEETNQNIKNTMTEIFIDWVDEIVGKYNSAIEGMTAKIDDIQFELDVLELIDPENIEKELNLLAQRAREYSKQEATMQNMVNHLQKEYDKAVKKYGKSSKEAQKVKQELDNAKEALEDVTIQMLRAEKDIEDARAKVADKGISQLRDYYGKMKDMALKAIEFEKRELQKAHEAKMKMYDEEIKRINEIYDERLKAMDKEKEEAEYQEQLNEKNEKRAELVNKISLLSRDTSVEGRKRVDELRRELEQLDREIAQFMRERQDKLLREEIENQRKQQIEKLEAQKEAEQEQYDTRVEELDKEADNISKYYDNMLNDERKWAEMRENFIKGSFSTLTQELEEMSKQLARMTQGNFDNLTKGFSGFSEELKQEFADLFRIDISNLNFNSEGLLDKVLGAQKSKYGVYIGDGYSVSNPKETTWSGSSSAVVYEAKAPTSSSSSSKSKSSSSKSSSSTSGKPLKIGGKAKVTAKNAPAFLDSYGTKARPWADQAKYAGVGYSDALYVVNMRGNYVALAKRNNINDAIAWVRKQDVIGLKTGGYTGEWVGQDGKLALLHKKELVLNEKQTSHILDTAKIMDKITRIIPDIKRGSIVDKLATAGAVINNSISYGDIYVTVENGDKKKAKDIATEIIKGIKKRGK